MFYYNEKGSILITELSEKISFQNFISPKWMFCTLGIAVGAQVGLQCFLMTPNLCHKPRQPSRIFQ